MEFTKTDNTSLIKQYRATLYHKLKAPIDVMWEQLYIGSSQHYLIEQEGRPIGYCCIDTNKCLNQVFLEEGFNAQMEQVIKALIDSDLIISASLSSNEPIAFNACLFHSKSIKTNTFCFQHLNRRVEEGPALALELVAPEEIPAIKVFLKEQVGMDDTFGYTQNLVDRKEIYRIREGDTIIATSECRLSDSQPRYADLGIIVNSNYRGRGIAKRIMKMQVNRVIEMGRQAICSTTHDNIASRKAIEAAGFYCSNIIFDISFSA